jgi:hypothetical protein
LKYPFDVRFLVFYFLPLILDFHTQSLYFASEHRHPILDIFPGPPLLFCFLFSFWNSFTQIIIFHESKINCWLSYSCWYKSLCFLNSISMARYDLRSISFLSMSYLWLSVSRCSSLTNCTNLAWSLRMA